MGEKVILVMIWDSQLDKKVKEDTVGWKGRLIIRLW